MTRSISRKLSGFITAHRGMVAAMGALVCLLFLRPPLNSASVITRLDVAKQMGKALCAIKQSTGGISATYEHIPQTYSDLSGLLSPEVQGILSLGIMRGYPDKTFRPAEPMRMGELLSIWAAFSKHLQAMTNNSGFGATLSRHLKVPSFLYWMKEDLANLAGIGLLSLPFPEDFSFDRPVSDSDLMRLTEATMEFFGHSQILTCTIGDLTMISLRKQPKAASPRDKTEQSVSWSYSTDQKNWIESHAGDLLRIPFDQAQGIFSFKLPGFLPGHIEIKESINRVLSSRLSPEPSGTAVVVHDDDDHTRMPPKCSEMPAREQSVWRRKDSPRNDLPTMALSGCIPHRGETSSQKKTVEHSGKICNALTRTPLSGASLAVGGIVVTTDDKGEFGLPPLPKGSLIEFFITAEGYQSLAIQHLVGHKTAPLQFFLKPYKSSLRVKIVSAANGEPIIGVSACLGDKTFTTDAAGRFESKATPTGYHKVTLEAPGYLASQELVFIEETPTTRIIKLHPQL